MMRHLSHVPDRAPYIGLGLVRIHANPDQRALGPRVAHEFLDARLAAAEAANFAPFRQERLGNAGSKASSTTSLETTFRQSFRLEIGAWDLLL